MLTLQDLLRTKMTQPPLNKALYFDGVDDYVLVRNNPTLNPDYVTIEAWALAYSKPTWAKIVGKPFTSATSPWQQYTLAHYGNSGMFVFEFNVNNTWYAAYGFTFNLNEWYHVVGVYDGVSGKLYVNGNFVSKRDVSGVLSKYDTDLRVGSHLGREYWNGLISIVRIYTRPLADSETLWNYLNPNNPIRDGLVLWLDARACDASKNICYDLSGNDIMVPYTVLRLLHYLALLGWVVGYELSAVPT
jgi:hypothetical protein